MARTLLATLPAAALALRATRTTVSMHTNIFPTFTIKDFAKARGQRPQNRGQRARTVALPAAASHAAVCWELGLVV